MVTRIWNDHSLSVVLSGLGIAFFAIAIPFREGTAFDTVLGLGHGCWTAVLINWLAGKFRERNKPED